MRLRHIEVVHAIRVTGSLTAAAELLSLTQPAITQILQSAERQLGYPLFYRVRGKLSPTKEALRLFPEIHKLNNQLEAVQRLAENLRGGVDDSAVRVVAAPALAQTIAADTAAAFARQYPATKISLRADYSATAVSNIALLEADIGILYHGVSHPAITEEVLAESRLVCVGPRSVLPSADAIDLAFLDGREIIAPDPGDPLGRLLSETLHERSLTVRTTITGQSYHSLITLSARSGQITIVDEVSAITAKELGLQVVPLRPAIAIPIVASVAISGERSVHTQRFVQICKDVLRACRS
jgi:DNA-binding transcriptional LysR family regulator